MLVRYIVFYAVTTSYILVFDFDVCRINTVTATWTSILYKTLCLFYCLWGMHLHRRTCLHKHPLITTASDFVQDKKIRKTHFCVKINPIFLTFWNSYRKLNYKNYLNLETWYLDNNLIPVKTLCDKKPEFLFVGIYSSETIYFSTYIVHDLCWWAWDCRPTKLTCFVRQVRVSTLLYWLMWILK